MSDEFNWKRFQFIVEVQTALINNATNKSLESDARQKRHEFSATGTLINMDDAFYASERIPENRTAHEAACEFVEFCLGLDEGKERRVPGWFARG